MNKEEVRVKMNALQRALHIETHVARIIGKQSITGVQFDVTRANFYIHVLEERTRSLYRHIRPHLQLEVESPYSVPVHKPFLKSGGYSDAVKKWFEGGDITQVSAPFTRVRFVEPDLGKRGKLINQLLRLGWVPREYTPITEKGGGGSPKLTVDGEVCPSLLEIGDELGRSIAEWYILKHRQSQIKGLVSIVRDDGRIPAEAHTIGTPTYRFRHSKVVNIPKAAEHVVFGKQMRSLFTVKGKNLHQRINERGRIDEEINKLERSLYRLNIGHQGYKMVGHDASGLELRILAHYIGDEEFTRQVSEGDPHTANQIAAGLPTRDAAKTFIYAFIYGAGNRKIGLIVGGGTAEGRAIKQRFLEANPKLAGLIEGVRSAARKGWIKGIDGRRVRIRRDPVTRQPQVHKALNTLIQTGGALVMKYSMVWLDLAISFEGLNNNKVIDMHDEGQNEVTEEDAKRVAYLAEESIRVAGQYLGIKCPLDAEASIGIRWSETH